MLRGVVLVRQNLAEGECEGERDGGCWRSEAVFGAVKKVEEPVKCGDDSVDAGCGGCQAARGQAVAVDLETAAGPRTPGCRAGS